MLKSFWFWFLVVWCVIVAAGLAVALALVAPFPWWGWLVAGVLLVAGLATGWILRQRALIRELARGRERQSKDTFEEAWKGAFGSDVRKLVAASAPSVQSGVHNRDALEKRRIAWVVSDDPRAVVGDLVALGARDLGAARSHELSGEFDRCASWLVKSDLVLLVLKELPDARMPASTERLALLIEEFAKTGRQRAVDVALAWTSDKGGRKAESLHAALSWLAEASGVEFPLHVALALEGSVGAELARIAKAMPGARVSAGRQEDLPKILDEAWTRFRSGLDGKEPGLVEAAWKAGGDPAAMFLELESLRGLQESTRASVTALAGGYTTHTQPFLRGFHLRPRDVARAQGGADSGKDAPVSRGLLDQLAEDAELARLGSRRQVRASVFATACLLASVVVSCLLVAAALHGSIVGGRLGLDWSRRFEAAKSAPWTTPQEMAASLPQFAALDSLVTEIDDGRPWLLAPGFYPDGRILPAARGELERRIREMNAAAFEASERLVVSRMSDTAALSGDVGDLYRDLKTYLLASREGWAEGRKQEGEDGLAGALVRTWATLLALPEPMPARERELLPRLAAVVADRIDDGAEDWLGSADLALLGGARLQLRSAKNQTGTYARVLGAADSLPVYTADSLGLPVADIGCRDFEIRPAFTRAGWLKSVKPTLDELATGKPDWVLGAQADTTSASTTALAISELRRRYVEDFVTVWAGAFDSTRCALPSDNQRIASALQILSSPYLRQNPRGLQAFLARFLEETNLAPEAAAAAPAVPLPANVARAAATAGRVADAVSSHLPQGDLPVEKQVSEKLAAHIAFAQDAQKGGMDTYNKDLQALAQALGQQAGGQDAMAFAGAVLRQDPKNPLVHALGEAEALRNKLPVGLHRWWENRSRGILLSIASSLLPQATQAANKSFREQVWQPWQNLSKGGYPFDPYAENETSIDELDRFLNPQSGALALYLRSVENILEIQGEDIVPRAGNGMAVAIDQSTLQGLRKLLRMGTFFYGKGGSAFRGANATLTMRGDTRAKVSLQVGSNSMEIPYGGEKKMNIRWPQKGMAGAGVAVSTISSNHQERREGEWGLLRLLEIKGGGVTDVTLSFQDRSYILDVPLSVRLDQPGGPFLDKDFFRVPLGPDLFR